MPQWIERIKASLAEITGLVTLLIGYGMGVTGKSPTPWPQTTAALLVLVSTLFLTRQWWSRLTRRSGLFFVGATTQLPWRDQLIDPFVSRNRISYLLPLSRRRLEGIILSAMLVATLGLSTTKFPSIVVEVNPSTGITQWKNCEGDGSRQSMLIAIAEFHEVNEPLLFEDRLYDRLTSRIRWLGRIRVCQSGKVIETQKQAIDFGEQSKAVMVIWGRSDAALYEVNIEIANWELPDYALRSFPTPEAYTPSFQEQEPPITTFYVEYILSQILYLRGDTAGARELLAGALSAEQIDTLRNNPDNRKDITDAFYLSGYFFDRPASPEPDLDQAIKYYSEAIEIDETFYSAYLNRGLAYKNTGQYEKAVVDFKTAASLTEDTRPDLAAAALIDAAWVYADTDVKLANDYFTQAIALDPEKGYSQRGLARLSAWRQPDQAIVDFLEALAQNRSDPYLYHYLGQAQLINGQSEEALQSYQDAISAASWDMDARDNIIEDLRALAQKYPDQSETVSQIIQVLESLN